tara:strand:+ start:2706 stop:3818 length:1113 start_codon:yes stop_codon:yes gene_type:complete
MKILYYFTFGYSLKSWEETGTLQKELRFFQAMIDKHNVEFVFVTYGNEEDENILQEYKNINVIPIYKFIKFSNNKLIMYIKSFYFPLKLRKIIKDVDIIKQNQLQGSWASLILKFLINKPLYLRTGYDVLSFSIMENKSKLKISTYRLITRIMLKFANIYSVTSNVDKNYLEKIFGKSHKIILRPNWIIKNNHIRNNRENKFISVGRLEQQKNYNFLIDNFNDKNFEFHIYGSGQEKENLEKKANEKKANIVFHGNINNDILMEKYEDYKYYISPSFYEGNPKSLLEAMSKGCVVIASDIASHREIIDHNENGFLFKFTDKDLKNKIEKLMNDKDLTEKISSNAIKTMNERNDIENLIDDTYKDYLNLTY